MPDLVDLAQVQEAFAEQMAAIRAEMAAMEARHQEQLAEIADRQAEQMARVIAMNSAMANTISVETWAMLSGYAEGTVRNAITSTTAARRLCQPAFRKDRGSTKWMTTVAAIEDWFALRGVSSWVGTCELRRRLKAVQRGLRAAA